MVSVPIGYRFMPTNEEVIKYYLSRYAMGLPVPATQHIVEKQLYGENADPLRVLGDVDDSHWDIVQQEGSKSSKDDRVIYVLTKLTKNGKRVSRRAGKGTWSGQTGAKDIRDSGSGQLIGSLKMFSYEADPAEGNNDGFHWIMHEFSLTNIPNDVKKQKEEFVICKIRRTTSKRKESCGQQHYAPPPSFKKHKAAIVDHPPQQPDHLVLTPPTPAAWGADNHDVINLDDECPIVSNDHHPPPPVFMPQLTINYDDQCVLAADQEGETNVACPNVVGDGGSTRAETHHHDVISLDDDVVRDDGPTTTAAPDALNREEESTQDMERPSSDHNAVVAGTVDEGALSTLVDSFSNADNYMMSLDDLEDLQPDLIEGLEFNLDDMDLYFTDCFVA